MNWITTVVFGLQTLLELTSNWLTNIIFATPLDTFFDPFDTLLSAVLLLVGN